MDSSAPNEATAKPRISPELSLPSRPYAYFVLALLTSINLVNYIDRYIVAAVGSNIKKDLNLEDKDFGLVLSCVIISYTVAAPLFGWLGDRGERRRWLGIGIALWSLATALAGLAQTYHQLLLARSLIGIGEACYATIAPSLIADVIPKQRRGMALGIFFAAIPLGTGFGLMLGALAPMFDVYFGPNRGWRPTMFVVGGPGLLLAAIVYFLMPEPRRGTYDPEIEAATSEPGVQDQSFGSLLWRSLVAYAQLLTIPTFLVATLAYTALTFALGGLGDWAPTFLQEDKHLPQEKIALAMGLIVMVGGFVGTFGGGALGDWLGRYTKNAYFLVCGFSVVLAVVPVCVAVRASETSIIIGAMFVSVLFLFMSNAPVNALVVNSVAPNVRASAMALNILCIHIFGDVISRNAIGWLSTAIDRSAEHGTLSAPVIRLAELFALDPATQHLSIALLITPVAMLVAGFFFFLGTRTMKS